MSEESIYQKDKHAAVRVLFCENKRIGKYVRGQKKEDGSFRRGDEDVPLIMTFIATYVMEMSIFCVDASIVTLQHSILPDEIDAKSFERRVLETHDFASAVRRAVTLSNEMYSTFLMDLREKLGDKLIFPLHKD